MDFRNLRRPALTVSDALEIVKRLYGLSGSLKELPSYHDQNFHLVTDAGDEFVLKITSESEKRETLEFQNRAMHHLASQSDSIISPRVLKTITEEEITQIETDEGIFHFVRVVTYLPGCVMSSVNPQSPEFLIDFGRFIGSISESLNDFDHPATRREFYWDLQRARSTIRRFKEHIADPEKQKLIEYFGNLYETLVEPRMDELRTSVIHNDANDNNIIVNNPHNNNER
ncbi:MAG: hypothetical protein E3J86_02685, partial [Candidatus Thorarchaeota archaeon]